MNFLFFSCSAVFLVVASFPSVHSRHFRGSQQEERQLSSNSIEPTQDVFVLNHDTGLQKVPQITNDFTIRVRFRVLEVSNDDFEIVAFNDGNNYSFLEGILETPGFLGGYLRSTEYDGVDATTGFGTGYHIWSNTNEIIVTRYSSTREVFVWVNGIPERQLSNGAITPFFVDTQNYFRSSGDPTRYIEFFHGAKVAFELVETYSQACTPAELGL